MKTETIILDGVELLGPIGVNEAYADKALWKAVTNGCGPGWAKYDLVPDRAYGLHIGFVCDLHDFSWHTCELTEDNFYFWNDIFRQNFRTWVKAKTAWYNPLRYPRLARANTYYLAVNSWAGWDIFENGK